MLHAFVRCFSVLLGANALAQTFVVDASGGPGSNFTSMATATASVPSGAVLSVRPGSYGGFTIQGKSLTVNADAGAVFDVSGFDPIDILQVGSSQRVVLRGVTWRRTGTRAHLRASQNAGLVILDGMRLLGNGPAHLSWTDCAQVVLRDYASPSWSALDATNSHLVMERCEFGTLSMLQAGSGVSVTGGSLQVVDSTIGNGITSISPGSALHVANGAAVRLLGNTQLSGQLAFGGGATFAVGITGQGVVELAPSVQFVFTSAQAAPTVSLVVQAMPRMAAVAAGLGGAMLEVGTEPGDLAAMFASLPGPRTMLPHFLWPSWQDLGSLIPLAAGLTGSSGVLQQAVALPSIPQLVVVVQGVALGPVTGFAITQPTFLTGP